MCDEQDVETSSSWILWLEYKTIREFDLDSAGLHISFGDYKLWSTLSTNYVATNTEPDGHCIAFESAEKLKIWLGLQDFELCKRIGFSRMVADREYCTEDEPGFVGPVYPPTIVHTWVGYSLKSKEG